MAGADGEPGRQGPRGPKGAIITVGNRVAAEKGDSGDIGWPGLQGPDGDVGQIGFPGTPGFDGEIGEPGLDGLPVCRFVYTYTLNTLISFC